MGQVVIEIPQNVNRSFRVKDLEFGEKLLRDLEQNSNAAETPAIVPPAATVEGRRRGSSRHLGGRPESAKNFRGGY